MKNKITKKLAIPLGVFLAIAFVAAAVIFSTTHVVINVNEALNATTVIPVSPSAFPGENATTIIVVNNAATGDLPVTISWTETANVSAISYAYSGPSAQLLTPGLNNITLTWSITTGSNVGTFEGDIVLTRI